VLAPVREERISESIKKLERTNAKRTTTTSKGAKGA
jgi:hypothetical protein